MRPTAPWWPPLPHRRLPIDPDCHPVVTHSFTRSSWATSLTLESTLCSFSTMVHEQPPRLSLQALKVLSVLLEGPATGLAGYDMIRSTGVPSGSLYPMLARFERLGWVNSWWEEVDPRQAGRPRRRYYHITGIGAQEARDALSQLQLSLFSRGGPAWA